MKVSRILLAIIVTAGFLAACGGGSSSAPVSVSNPQPQTVQGLTTPKTVSVVTAN